jgi:molybdopterin-synthase adenylyltransferase
VLEIGDDDRFDRQRLIAWWDQPRLASARVIVIGAGALGNEVLKNLALLGVGHVVVVDMDRIERSNLSRSVLFRSEDRGEPKAIVAAHRLRELHPEIEVTPLVGEVSRVLGMGWYFDADLAIGCLDNREARMWVNRCCWRAGKPWIDGGIQEISGVVQVFKPHDGTCYECGMKEIDYQLAGLRYSCPLLKREDLQQGRMPTVTTIGSIIAGWQVQEAVKLLHGMDGAVGHAMVFHGLTNHIYKSRLPRREDCLAHEDWTSLQVQSIAAAKAPIDALGQLPEDAVLELSNDVVTLLRCEPCDHQVAMLRPASEVTQREATCAHCQQPMQPSFTHTIDRQHPLVDQSCDAWGIAAADVVLWHAGEQSGLVRFPGSTFDRSRSGEGGSP